MLLEDQLQAACFQQVLAWCGPEHLTPLWCQTTVAPPRALGVAHLRLLLFLQFGVNLCPIWVLGFLPSDHRHGLSSSLINFSPEDVCPCFPHCCGQMT